MKKKKNKKKKIDNSKIIKIGVISCSVLLFCAICFAASLSSGEDYSSSSSSSDLDEDNILETATKEAGEVSDDERTKPTEITIDDYLEAYQKEEYTVILFARDSCEYCKLATPILENIIYESHVDLKYVDLGSLSDDDKTNLVNSNDYFSEGISTPLVIVVGNNQIVDEIEGLVTKENYTEFFKSYGFME